MTKRAPKAKRRRTSGPKRCSRQTPLKKERGIWVYHGEPSDESIVDLIDRGREARIRELIGSATKNRTP